MCCSNLKNFNCAKGKNQTGAFSHCPLGICTGTCIYGLPENQITHQPLT
jgi:hypothetical protein